MKNLKTVSRYYITIKCRTNDNHAIHRESCPFIEDDENIICLGHFLSSGDAMAEGKKHFDHSQCCRFCIPDSKAVFAETHVQSSDTLQMLPADSQLSDNSGGSVYFLLN